MKKLLFTFSLVMGFVAASMAQVCTPDSTHFTNSVYVYPASLPCITQGVAFSGTVSIKAPDSIDAHTLYSAFPANTYYIHLDSMVVDSVTGFPTGITATDFPAFGQWIKGGSYGCSTFAGTTTAAVDSYPLAIHGRACGHGTFPILGAVDTCMALNFSSFFPYTVNVCAGSPPPVCTPDTTHFTTGQYVYPDSLPCIQHGVPYSGVISIQIPDSIDASNFSSLVPPNTYYIHVDSMRIDSMTGMPAGITAQTNPGSGVWLHGGQYGCGLFTGTTVAPGGNYPLNIYGRGCIHGTILIYHIDSCQSGNLGAYIKYSLNVCAGVGVTEVASGVDFNIYPNPNQGAFTVTVSSADHMSGQMTVRDQLGRTIKAQDIDVTGTKQLPIELGNIAPGVYILSIQSANGRMVKEFVVK